MVKNWDPAPSLVLFYPTSSFRAAPATTGAGRNSAHAEVPLQDRRLGFRIPFETMVTSYVHDRPVRGLVTNLSDSGVNISAISMLAPPPGIVVGIELDVPGMTESVWASAQVCPRSRGVRSGV